MARQARLSAEALSDREATRHNRGGLAAATRLSHPSSLAFRPGPPSAHPPPSDLADYTEAVSRQPNPRPEESDPRARVRCASTPAFRPASAQHVGRALD